MIIVITSSRVQYMSSSYGFTMTTHVALGALEVIKTIFGVVTMNIIPLVIGEVNMTAVTTSMLYEVYEGVIYDSLLNCYHDNINIGHQ